MNFDPKVSSIIFCLMRLGKTKETIQNDLKTYLFNSLKIEINIFSNLKYENWNTLKKNMNKDAEIKS